MKHEKDGEGTRAEEDCAGGKPASKSFLAQIPLTISSCIILRSQETISSYEFIAAKSLGLGYKTVEDDRENEA